LPALGCKKFLEKNSEFLIMVFRVGDLIRMKDDCWWLREDGARFRSYTEKDRLVLVTKMVRPHEAFDSREFFYGRVCSTGEERLWTAGEFELVSSRH
jgi:hypothetical protein